MGGAVDVVCSRICEIGYGKHTFSICRCYYIETALTDLLDLIGQFDGLPIIKSGQ